MSSKQPWRKQKAIIGIVSNVRRGINPKSLLVWQVTFEMDLLSPGSGPSRYWMAQFSFWPLECKVERGTETLLPAHEQKEIRQTVGHSNPEETDDDLMGPMAV